MIVKEGTQKYVLYSHTGKVLGKFRSQKAAEAREKEIKMFKHLSKKK